MRCKVGDLAVVVACRGDSRNNGMLVEVIAGPAVSDSGSLMDWQCVVLFSHFRSGEGLLVRSEDYFYCCMDDELRPLRDGDGEDETLQWAGMPDGVQTMEVAQ